MSEFTTDLMTIAFKTGTRAREAASLLSALVVTSELAHPDAAGSTAHNMLRCEALLCVLQEQLPELTVDGSIEAMIKAGDKASKIMSYVISRADVNITVRALRADSHRRIINGSAAVAKPGAYAGGYAGAAAGAEARTAEPRAPEPRATDTRATGGRYGRGTYDRQEQRDRKAVFAIHVVGCREERAAGRACHNCGDTAHFWLECTKPYDEARWRKVVKDAGADSRLGRVAPRTEEYFIDMQRRFTQRQRDRRP
jgi:hypothetical protein